MKYKYTEYFKEILFEVKPEQKYNCSKNNQINMRYVHAIYPNKKYNIR